MNLTTTDFLISLKLSPQAHYFARQFSSEQKSTSQAKQVYLNTLAVYGVYTYLAWLEFNVDLAMSDSWNYLARQFQDIADLNITNIGKLECRPVLATDSFATLPLEATEDRIGCIIVQLETELDAVNLLGFYPANQQNTLPTKIKISELQDFEYLTEYLDELEQQINSSNCFSITNLSHWLDNAIDRVWQNTLDILGAEKNQLALGNARLAAETIIRAKPIVIDRAVNSVTLALVVGVVAITELSRRIPIQIHPLNAKFLPPELTLVALDASRQLVEQERAGNDREWIQINVEGKPGEHFIIAITLGTIAVERNFVI